MGRKFHKHKNKYITRKRSAQNKKYSLQPNIKKEIIQPKKDGGGQNSNFEEALKKAGEQIITDEKERSKLINLIIEICVGIWRVEKKMPDKNSGLLPELIKINRPIETMKDLLHQNGFVIQDLTGQDYIDGMTLEVIAWQPTEGIIKKMITESIKPRISYLNQIIEPGEVIVGVPKLEKQNVKDNSLNDKEQDLFDIFKKK